MHTGKNLYNDRATEKAKVISRNKAGARSLENAEAKEKAGDRSLENAEGRGKDIEKGKKVPEMDKSKAKSTDTQKENKVPGKDWNKVQDMDKSKDENKHRNIDKNKDRSESPDKIIDKSREKSGNRKENTHKGRHNFALVVLVFIMLFTIQFATVLFALLMLFILVQTNVITMEWVGNLNTGRVILLVAVVDTAIGLIVVFTATAVPLKPVNNLINQINRLASGDFQARLQFGRILASYPTFAKLTDSFNKMAEELGNTEVLRNDFVNNFSHEFKTPIVSIAGFAKVLKRGNLTREQQLEYLDVIEAESLRLSSIATNVLNLARIENQTILTDVTEFNLSEQIRYCILVLEHKWAPKGLNWKLDFEEHVIRAGEELLKHVWINLIDNAVKFSGEGETIEIRLLDKGDSILVSVIDFGPEIPEESKDKIFRKFYQADESHSSEGSGVGLAVVKRVVELHGGTVRAEKMRGGACFVVELPKIV